MGQGDRVPKQSPCRMGPMSYLEGRHCVQCQMGPSVLSNYFRITYILLSNRLNATYFTMNTSHGHSASLLP